MVRNQMFAIGKITGVHGIKGAVKIYSYAESFARFESGSEIILKSGEGIQKRHEITYSWPHKKGGVLGISEVLDRNQAESLIGFEIYIESACLPDLEEGTYYWSDLIGLSVFSEDRYLGELTSILPTGSNDVYVVIDHVTGRETLVPALASVVKVIDLDNGHMRVALPEGL